MDFGELVIYAIASTLGTVVGGILVLVIF